MKFFNKGKQEGIYLDYAATTPVSERVREAMDPYFSDNFGNPSSLHLAGQRAQSALDQARQDVADVLECSWKEVFFASSATQSINAALRGVAKKHKNPHIITTNIEHSAVLNTLQDLEEEGVDVSYIPVSEEGLVNGDKIKEALKENTVLVSVMYVNNEIGTIQPIQEISEILKDHSAHFHVDAVQAANYLDIKPDNLGVDFMSISGHKIYGPKGSALLFKREGIDIDPIITGGEQERKMFAGTENMPAIAGFAEALKETEELKQSEAKRIKELRDKFIKEAVNSSSNVVLNGSEHQRIQNNINVYFENTPSEVLIPLFDAEGVYVSGGSACTSRTPEPSHVMEALGREKYARNSIRITLGRHTTEENIANAISVFKKISKEHN